MSRCSSWLILHVSTVSTRLIASLAVLDGLLLLLVSSAEVNSWRSYLPVDSLVWTTTCVQCGAAATLLVVGVIGLARKFRVGSRLAGSNHPDAEASAKLGVLPRNARSFLVVLGLLSVYLLMAWVWKSPSIKSVLHTRILCLVSRLPPVPARWAWGIYGKMWEDSTFVKVPYNPGGDQWWVLQGAMTSFAATNGILISEFESLSPSQAYVYVDWGNAPAMRQFLSSMGQSANPQGGANGGQPVRSETNRTPAASAPRRSP